MTQNIKKKEYELIGNAKERTRRSMFPEPSVRTRHDVLEPFKDDINLFASTIYVCGYIVTGDTCLSENLYLCTFTMSYSMLQSVCFQNLALHATFYMFYSPSLHAIVCMFSQSSAVC